MVPLLIFGALALLGLPFILSLVHVRRIDALSAKLEQLTERIAVCERAGVAERFSPAPQPAAELPPLPSPPASSAAGSPRSTPTPPLPTVPSPAAAAPSWAKSIDWEAFMGVKLFAWLGGFVLFLGVVFLVKYSFENNLITPGKRVLIGAMIGCGLIAAGWFTATRSYRVPGQSLCATGVLVLYADIFGAHNFYDLISLTPAFLCMSVVTIAAFLLAVRLDAQVVVILGLVGGFLTPVLLSTNVDHPAALFGYIALLNTGIAAVAMRKRWFYLVALAAAGTVFTEWGWGWKFFEEPKANIAFVVFLGFLAQFLAIVALAQKRDPDEDWSAWAATGIGFAVLAWAFCFLTYEPVAHRPLFLFSFVLIADVGLLLLATRRTNPTAIASLAGSVVFAFFAAWTGKFLTGALLWWALGGFIAFALLHAAFALWPKRVSARPKKDWLRDYIPLLPLALIWICVWKTQTSPAVWFSVLLLDLVLVLVAIVKTQPRMLVVALVATLAATGLWIVSAPPRNDELIGFLAVTCGFGIFFFSAATFAARRFGSASPELHRNLPALAAAMPFALLLMAVVKLPILNPTPVFIVAFVLAVLLLSVGIASRTSLVVAIALLFTWAVQREWQSLHFANAQAPVFIAWSVLFLVLFVGLPFFFADATKQLPWALSAVAGPLHFWLIFEAVSAACPALRNGLLPALFIVPYLFGAIYLVRKRGADPATGDARLAWQGGAALFFVSLIFPVQFDREWITLGWALEGLALLWLFAKIPHHGLRVVGVGLLCAAFARLALNPAVLEYHRRAPVHIWNWYLYAYGLTSICLLAGARLVRPPFKLPHESKTSALLNSLGTILLFLLLNIEIADYFSIGPTLTFSFSGDFARDMTYSIAWALFAFGLLMVGMKQKQRALRYAGLGLLMVTLLKLFLHDLGNLSQLYRIGAFIGVAVILIVASFVYQRFLAPAAKTPEPPISAT